jgi:uncharacterized membrane protein HdeD (DUF308 family)
VLVGLIWIIFSGQFVLVPEIVLGIFVVVVGAFLIIVGLSRIIRGVFVSKGSPHSLFLLLSGTFIGAIGIAAFIGPAMFAAALVYLVPLWAFIVGLGELGAAITLRGVPATRWLQGIKGGIVHPLRAAARPHPPDRRGAANPCPGDICRPARSARHHARVRGTG